MPIRFRCAYCQQLMSIATRKAGAVIRCTKCAGEIIVPLLEGTAPSDGAVEPDPGQAFEQANFDVELNPAATASSTPPTAPPTAAQPSTDPMPHGVVVGIPTLLISIGVVVLLLIAMFLAGFFIGRATTQPPAANAKFSRDPQGSADPGFRGWILHIRA